MTDRELMQQALEALVYCEALNRDVQKQKEHAVYALRDRLAQPEQKPVAWGVFDGPNLHDTFFTEEEAQEMVRLKGDGSIVKPLYATPPRQWVGLTDEEVEHGLLRSDYALQTAHAWRAGVVFAMAKLKEKNA